MMNNKEKPSILGNTSLLEKLSKARHELEVLRSEDNKANHESKNNAIQESKSQSNPEALTKFHLSGRCNRKDQKYTMKAFYILDGLDADIKRYCDGGDVALFNYLIHLGLSEIKKRDGHSFDKISNFEALYHQ